MKNQLLNSKSELSSLNGEQGCSITTESSTVGGPKRNLTKSSNCSCFFSRTRACRHSNRRESLSGLISSRMRPDSKLTLNEGTSSSIGTSSHGIIAQELSTNCKEKDCKNSNIKSMEKDFYRIRNDNFLDLFRIDRFKSFTKGQKFFNCFSLSFFPLQLIIQDG